MYSLEAATGCVHQKSELKNFVKFTRKHLWRRLIPNKVTGHRPATSLKRDSGIKVFLWIFRGYQLFCTAALGDCFWAVLIIAYNFEILLHVELFKFLFWATNSHKNIVCKKLVHWFPKSMYLNKVETFQNYEKNKNHTPPFLLLKK